MEQTTSPEDFIPLTQEELTVLINLPRISRVAARRGVISCFINIKQAQLTRGAQLLNRDSSPEAVRRYGYYLARSTFNRLNIPFDDPTPDQLARIVDEMNKSWEFAQVDEDLRHIHDYVCGQIVQKTT